MSRKNPSDEQMDFIVEFMSLNCDLVRGEALDLELLWEDLQVELNNIENGVTRSVTEWKKVFFF